MARKTICDGLKRLSSCAASASRTALLSLLVAVGCAWLSAAQAQAPRSAPLPSAASSVDAALAEAGLLDMAPAPAPASAPAPTVGEEAALPLRGEDRDDAAPETGLASWYGPGFHRRRTASGERFDMYAMTAAHPTLAFGTFICVRSQVTGRGVVVRVNDRGPHVQGRIVDLSRAAAIALGLHGLGLKPVSVFPLADGESTCPEE